MTRPQKDFFAPLGYVGFALVAAVLVYSFVSAAREGETRRRCSATCLLRPNYAGADRRAPDFSLPDMTGRAVTLSSFRGKVVLLNFWTKTCGPCLEEMPEIVELTKVLRERKDVVVLTVSTDDGPEDVRETLESIAKDPVPFSVLFDPGAKVVGDKFGTRLFPETWLLDKSGVIRARFDGAREWSNPAVVELIDQLRNGGYCPLEVKQGRATGEAAKFCEDLAGG